MKKSFLFFLAICLLVGNPLAAQKGGLLKKVAKSMTNELLGKPEEGTSNSNSNQPEPSCACSDAVAIVGLGGKLQLDYKETNIDILEDGSLLLKDRIGGKFYVVKDGETQGPLPSQDPRVKQFDSAPNNDTPDSNDSGIDAIIAKNKPYMSKSGDKILITFDGKTYGPYAQVNKFVVSKFKDRFAAIVLTMLAMTSDEAKKMEAESKKAKTEQEQMDLAMQYSQNLQEKMMAGGPDAFSPKLITNVPNSTTDQLIILQGQLSNQIKYDDILFVANDKIIDLTGKTLMTIKPGSLYSSLFFINSDNTKTVTYDYGTLTFSDNKTLSDALYPGLMKINGKVFLSYMYYSPKKNALMQCKIPF